MRDANNLQGRLFSSFGLQGAGCTKIILDGCLDETQVFTRCRSTACLEHHFGLDIKVIRSIRGRIPRYIGLILNV